MRSLVERGSMPYSAVTQPSPLPRRKPGTRFSTLAVHSTRVSPKLISTEPSACRVNWRSMRIVAQLVGRRGRWVGRRGSWGFRQILVG